MYVVLHIPKTAGSTLRANFELNFGSEGILSLYRAAGPPGKAAGYRTGAGEALRQYWGRHGSPQTRCIIGHNVTTDLHEWIPLDPAPRYITFLRDPVDRCVSLYSHLKRLPASREGQMIQENSWSLEDWIERGSHLHVSNAQVKFLLRGADFRFPREVGEKDLAEAKRRLQRFWFVGLTERFNADAHYLYGTLDFKRYHPKLVTNAAETDRLVSAAARQRLAERNALDTELYTFASRRRTEFVRRPGSRFNRQRSKAWLSRGVDLPRQLLYASRRRRVRSSER